MFDKIKEKIVGLVANAVIIGGVFGVVVPDVQILNAVDVTSIAVAAVLSTIAGWQAAVWGK